MEKIDDFLWVQKLGNHEVFFLLRFILSGAIFIFVKFLVK